MHVCLVMSDSLQPHGHIHLSMEFSRQEYCSRLPFPPLRDILDPGIQPTSLCLLHWQVDSLPTIPAGKPQECQAPELKAMRYQQVSP